MELRIMVTGATGTMGQEVVNRLRQAGADFIAVSRSLERLPQGVPGLSLNYDNLALLEQAFRGVDVLFFLQPLSCEMLLQAENIAKAARAAGVQFILRVSGLGASSRSTYLFQKVQGEVDEILEDCGVRVCILRPNIFMQSFISPFGDSLRQGVLYLPQGEGRTSFLDARDAAEVAQEILLDPWRYDRQSFDLTGERALSNAEALSLISHQVRRRVVYVPVTEEAALRNLEKSGADRWSTDLIMSMHKATREGQTALVSESVKEITGHGPRRFEDFCREKRGEWILRPPQEMSMF